MGSSYPKNDEPEVLEPEIIEPDSGQRSQGRQGSYRAYYASPGVNFWTTGNLYSGGCLAPGITAGFFLLALVQYGLLSAIGFMVFYAIGSTLGIVYQARQLMEGRLTNPWTWRVWNWAIAFFITVWLSGGLND